MSLNRCCRTLIRWQTRRDSLPDQTEAPVKSSRVMLVESLRILMVFVLGRKKELALLLQNSNGSNLPSDVKRLLLTLWKALQTPFLWRDEYTQAALVLCCLLNCSIANIEQLTMTTGFLLAKPGCQQTLLPPAQPLTIFARLGCVKAVLDKHRNRFCSKAICSATHWICS